MKRIFPSARLTCISLTIMIAIVTTFSGCTKNSAIDAPNASSSAPHKPVPDSFVGDFSYVSSTGGYVDQSGDYIEAFAQAIDIKINKDGTGSSLYHVQRGSYSGEVTSDDVSSKCTFEISLEDQNHVNITIHYVSGKDYHNNVYLHDLDASKVYPNGDNIWPGLEFGTDDKGKTYFIVPGADPLKFTKQ